MTVNLDSPYFIPTLFSFVAVKLIPILKDNDADVEIVVVGTANPASAAVVELGEERPRYWTVTSWRSNWGFLGLTARTMTRTTARARRARKARKRKRQQQHPLKEAEDDE